MSRVFKQPCVCVRETETERKREIEEERGRREKRYLLILTDINTLLFFKWNLFNDETGPCYFNHNIR